MKLLKEKLLNPFKRWLSKNTKTQYKAQEREEITRPFPVNLGDATRGMYKAPVIHQEE